MKKLILTAASLLMLTGTAFADSTINGLPDLGVAPASGDELAVWDLNAGVTKKNTVSDFFSGVKVDVGLGATPLDTLYVLENTTGKGITVEATGNTTPSITIDSVRTGANQGLGSFAGEWDGTIVATMTAMSGTDTTNKDDGYWRLGTRESGAAVLTQFQVGPTGAIQFENLGVDTADTAVSYDTSTKVFHYDSSATRFKQNIKEMEDTSWIFDIPAKNFNGLKEKKVKENGQKNLKLRKEYGALAEDMEAVNPDLVTYDENGELTSIRYTQLIMPIIQELAKLRARVAELESN